MSLYPLAPVMAGNWFLGNRNQNHGAYLRRKNNMTVALHLGLFAESVTTLIRK